MRSIVLVLVSAALAGCIADEPQSTSRAGPDCGGVQGLLVDDRFRPIALADGNGFVLIHETGAQIETDANGVFTLPCLPPGTYTLRIQVDGHEGASQQVVVSAGEMTEATLVARRVATAGEVLIGLEYAFFVACATEGGVFTTQGSACTLDQSGDSDRSSFTVDFSVYADMAGIVTEWLFNREGDYMLKWFYESDTAVLDQAADIEVSDESYVRHVGIPGEEGPGGSVPFEPERGEMRFSLFPHAPLYDETPASYGFGVTLGTKAQLLVTVVLQDDGALETYCGLCG